MSTHPVYLRSVSKWILVFFFRIVYIMALELFVISNGALCIVVNSHGAQYQASPP